MSRTALAAKADDALSDLERIQSQYAVDLPTLENHILEEKSQDLTEIATALGTDVANLKRTFADPAMCEKFAGILMKAWEFEFKITQIPALFEIARQKDEDWNCPQCGHHAKIRARPMARLSAIKQLGETFKTNGSGPLVQINQQTVNNFPDGSIEQFIRNIKQRRLDNK